MPGKRGNMSIRTNAKILLVCIVILIIIKMFHIDEFVIELISNSIKDQITELLGNYN